MLTEEEYWSLITFEQQRYNTKLQVLQSCFCRFENKYKKTNYPNEEMKGQANSLLQYGKNKRANRKHCQQDRNKLSILQYMILHSLTVEKLMNDEENESLSQI